MEDHNNYKKKKLHKCFVSISSLDRSKFWFYAINGATVHNSNFKVSAFTKFHI